MKKHLPTKRTANTVLHKLLAKEDIKLLKDKTQVVLMVGMPGSGKSTISEMLVAAFGYWRFSSDQIRMNELFPGQEHRLAKEHDTVMKNRELIYQELTKRIVTAVKRGQRVVVDATNLDEKRNLILPALLEVCEPEKIAFVMVKTPEEIMRKRFLKDQDGEVDKWQSVYGYWKEYFATGKASFPQAGEYPGVNLLDVQRFDLETYDWTINIGVIVWDIDDTLYHGVPSISQHIHGRVIDHIQELLAVSVDEAEARYQEIYDQLGSTTMTLDHLGLDGRRIIEDAFSQVDFTKALAKDERLLRLFQELNQFHHVVLSNSDSVSTRRKLKALGLPLKTFSAIFTTYDMPYVKPDPSVFEHVIKQTSFAPQQHLFVGDRLKADIMPAKAAGMHTALVWSHSDVPDVSFDTVYQVGRLFGVEV